MKTQISCTGSKATATISTEHSEGYEPSTYVPEFKDRFEGTLGAFYEMQGYKPKGHIMMRIENDRPMRIHRQLTALKRAGFFDHVTQVSFDVYSEEIALIVQHWINFTKVDAKLNLVVS